MKKNNSEWSKLRSDLMKEEKESLEKINKETAKLKTQAQKGLKTLAVIGGSVLVGVMIYKWFKQGNGHKAKKRNSPKAKPASKKGRRFRVCTNSSVANFVLKKVAPWVLKKWLQHKKR